MAKSGVVDHHVLKNERDALLWHTRVSATQTA